MLVPMKITVLIDNIPGNIPDLLSEHGLSFFIENDESRILCDMGASESFISNASLLGVDLSSIDFAFVSHGHSDHTGGLLPFLKSFEDTEIYMSNRVFNEKYFSSRRGLKRNISTDLSIETSYHHRLKFIDKSVWITPSVAAVYTDTNQFSKPFGNRYLTKIQDRVELSDDFLHEISLAIRTPKGLVIISSCSHGGAVNIMHSCCRFIGDNHVYAFIGGLHLVEGDNLANEVDVFCQEVQTNYPDVLFYTGHCTCDAAKQALREKIPIHFFSTGMRIEF